MPRKRPFSSKQKKAQLHRRRIKKAEGASSEDVDGDDCSVEVLDQATADLVNRTKASDLAGLLEKNLSMAQPLAKDKLNEQPNYGDSLYDPNRYKLHFIRESPEEILERKQLARQTYDMLAPETGLEMSTETVYQLAGKTLDFPRRPAWSYSLSKEQLEANEERYFDDYVNSLISSFPRETLSFFELNLETWRQLWRVLELSDIILLIVDIRHPVLLFPPSLFDYVKSLGKSMVLILNKVDLVHPALALSWQRYFIEKFPGLNVVLFSSQLYVEELENLLKMTRDFGSYMFRPRKYKHNMAGELPTVVVYGYNELVNVCKRLVGDKVDLSDWSTSPTGSSSYYAQEIDSDKPETRNFCEGGVVTLGCIGYPNVGKSSVINCLVGEKVVSVSKTPGHTKHFQTIHITQSVRLCDCPGLVFPSLAPKALQILAGIYPVAQVKEPYSVIRFLAERIPVPKILGLTLRQRITKRSKKRQSYGSGGNDVGGLERWSAVDICDAWAELRGFKTSKAARNDIYRAANFLLRLTQEGRIRLCFRPPGYSAANMEQLLSREVVDFVNDVKNCQLSYVLPSEATSSSDEVSDDGVGESDDVEASDGEDDDDVEISNPFSALVDQD